MTFHKNASVHVLRNSDTVPELLEGKKFRKIFPSGKISVCAPSPPGGDGEAQLPHELLVRKRSAHRLTSPLAGSTAAVFHPGITGSTETAKTAVPCVLAGDRFKTSAVFVLGFQECQECATHAT